MDPTSTVNKIKRKNKNKNFVTAVHIMPLSLPIWKPEPLVLKVDRPFAYRIVSSSSSLSADGADELALFVGSICKP